MIYEEKNLRNCLLIAMPQLMDPNFLHTVSIMASFDDKGAFGMIVNRPTNLNANQILGDQLKLEKGNQIPVFFGGPVQINSFWFLHGYPKLHEDGTQILDNLFMTTNLKTVETIVNFFGHEEHPKFRFLLGYAGWAAGQLEREISLASWVTGPIDTEELFSCNPDRLWNTALARLGVHDPNALVSPPTSGSAH